VRTASGGPIAPPIDPLAAEYKFAAATNARCARSINSASEQTSNDSVGTIAVNFGHVPQFVGDGAGEDEYAVGIARATADVIKPASATIRQCGGKNLVGMAGFEPTTP
jgi:hypothetical protein